MIPASASRAAPSSRRSTVRSTPTTWRTLGATTSAACAAPHATSSTSISGVSGASWSTVPAGRRTNGESGPENRPTWRVNESRTTSSWSVMRTLLQSRAVVVPASPANDVAVPVAMRSGSPVRAGTWPEDADDLVTPVAHARAPPVALRVRGRRRSRIRGSPSSPPAPAGGVDPRRPPPRDHAAPRPVDRGVLRAVDGRRSRRARARDLRPRPCAR